MNIHERIQLLHILLSCTRRASSDPCFPNTRNWNVKSSRTNPQSGTTNYLETSGTSEARSDCDKYIVGYIGTVIFSNYVSLSNSKDVLFVSPKCSNQWQDSVSRIWPKPGQSSRKYRRQYCNNGNLILLTQKQIH